MTNKQLDKLGDECHNQEPQSVPWENRFMSNFCFDKMDAKMVADVIVFFRSLLAQERQALVEKIEDKEPNMHGANIQAEISYCAGWNDCKNDLLEHLKK